LDKETKDEIVLQSIFGLLAMATSFAFVGWLAYFHTMTSVAYDFLTTSLVCMALSLLLIILQRHSTRKEARKLEL
jgi:predicted phage tail protein